MIAPRKLAFLVQTERFAEYGIHAGWCIVAEEHPGGQLEPGDMVLAAFAKPGEPAGVVLKHWTRCGDKTTLRGATPETTIEIEGGDSLELIGVALWAEPPEEAIEFKHSNGSRKAGG